VVLHGHVLRILQWVDMTRSSEDMAIIVLNWNRIEATRRCVSSLPADDRRWHAFVVDNGSVPAQRADQQSLPNSRVTILTSPTNLGFAGGVNLGLREAMREGFQQFLLLNNDALLVPGALEPLRRSITPGVAAVCPMIVDAKSGRVWSVGGVIHWRRGLTGSNFHGARPEDVPHASTECDFGSAACLLLSAAAVGEVGLFDETYFAYWEETDWCVRARRAGFRIVTSPLSTAIHEGGVSTSAQARLYFMVRNCLLFMRRHASRRQLATFTPTFFLWSIPAWSTRPALEAPMGTLGAIARALAWHLRRPRLPQAPSAGYDGGLGDT
jgi:GT2 family glycosyltransferase